MSEVEFIGGVRWRDRFGNRFVHEAAYERLLKNGYRVKGWGLRPTVPEVQGVIDALTDEEHARLRGPLHVVLDEGNYENWVIATMIQQALQEGDALLLALSLLLDRMTRSQRGRLSLGSR